MMEDNKIKSFGQLNQDLNMLDVSESNSTKDKVVEMYITESDMDEYTDYELVVKTEQGRKFIVKAEKCFH